MKKITVNIRYKSENTDDLLWSVLDNVLYQKLNETTRLSYPCFQNVFCKESTLEIYNKSIKESVLDVLKGVNCTIFAYGQTGTGKTYSIFGTEKNPGVIKLALNDIIRKIMPDRSGKIFISYIEIYNENINDLINLDQKVKLYSNNNNPFIKNITKLKIDNINQAMLTIERCERRRKTGQTEYNDKSSRSHTIFQIYIEYRNEKANLSLIDLAGSEKATGDNDRRKEGSYINKSLLALGNVVDGLIKNNFVNYRESKLTRILQKSLDGKCSVISLCLISPKRECLSESLSTLNFAARLSEIELKDREQRIVKIESADCSCNCCIANECKEKEKNNSTPMKKEEEQKTEDITDKIQVLNIIRNDEMYLKSELELYSKRIENLEEMIIKILSHAPSSRTKELFILEKNMFNLQLELIKRRKDDKNV